MDSSWGSILISIYGLDAHDLKKMEILMRQCDKKTLTFEYEFSFKLYNLHNDLGPENPVLIEVGIEYWENTC